MKNYVVIAALLCATSLSAKSHRNEYDNKRSVDAQQNNNDVAFIELHPAGEYALGKHPYKQKAEHRGKDVQLTIENRTGQNIKGDIEFFLSVIHSDMGKQFVKKIDAKTTYIFPKDRGVHFILENELLRTMPKKSTTHDVRVSNAGFVEEGFMRTMIFPWGIQPKNPHEYVYVLIENDDDEFVLKSASECN